MAREAINKADSFQRFADLRALVAPALEEVKTRSDLEHAFVVLVDPVTTTFRDVIGLETPSPLLDVFGAHPQAARMFLKVLREKRAVTMESPWPVHVAEETGAQHNEAGTKSFRVVPLLPTSSVLVAATPGTFSGQQDDDLLGITGELGAHLWEYLKEKEWTEAHNADLSLFESLRSMLHAVPDPVVLTNELNSIIYQNARARELFESHLDDSPGKRRAIELNNFLLSTTLSSFLLDQGTSLAREFTAVDPVEGSELLFEVISQAIEDPVTGERNLVSVLRNVTDLQKVIEELRVSLHDLQSVNSELRSERDRLNLVLENVGDPIIVTGPDREEILVNALAKRLLQPAHGAGPGRRTSGAYYTNDARVMAFLLDLQLADEDVRRDEMELIDPETEESVAMSITSTKVKSSLGQVAATVSVLHDLTQVRELERRRLEYQLFESEKLAALGRLAAAVAHEINNPLESIKNTMHLLQTDVPLGAPGRKFLDIATKETERVSRVIRQMLGFYRSGTTKSEINLNAVIEEALVLLQHQFAAGGVVARHEAGDIPAVTASVDQMKQVFLNLFLNARDGMKDGGELLVRTRRARNKEAEGLSGKQVLIEVKDSGSGIAPEHLAHIFDPFFSTKKESGGTGLGLWVCHDIVRDHGGEMLVRSHLGQGTVFTIALPAGDTHG